MQLLSATRLRYERGFSHIPPLMGKIYFDANQTLLLVQLCMECDYLINAILENACAVAVFMRR